MERTKRWAALKLPAIRISKKGPLGDDALRALSADGPAPVDGMSVAGPADQTENATRKKKRVLRQARSQEKNGKSRVGGAREKGFRKRGQKPPPGGETGMRSLKGKTIQFGLKKRRGASPQNSVEKGGGLRERGENIK